MIESWREFLYPLGFLSSLAFGARFILQWLTSEIERKSVVTKAFWQFSLIGNLLLLIHAFIQVQFHVCLVQACNAIISWRNLDLMHGPSQQSSLRSVLYMLLASVLSVCVIFAVQGYLLGSSFIEWFRLPMWDEQAPRHVSMLWHLIGAIGLVLFSSRFWVQWWYAEQAKSSYLGKSFWWLSLSGGILSLIYFVRIDDPVNIVGPAFGLIPYIRNLMLMKKTPVSE
jgi:lipid-A-disaccharide synthase-like uncharacterized protein